MVNLIIIVMFNYYHLVAYYCKYFDIDYIDLKELNSLSILINLHEYYQCLMINYLFPFLEKKNINIYIII